MGPASRESLRDWRSSILAGSAGLKALPIRLPPRGFYRFRLRTVVRVVTGRRWGGKRCGEKRTERERRRMARELRALPDKTPDREGGRVMIRAPMARGREVRAIPFTARARPPTGLAASRRLSTVLRSRVPREPRRRGAVRHARNTARRGPNRDICAIRV
jgi:hypothetical protein